MLIEVPEGWSHPTQLSIYASNETRKWNEVEALPYIGLEHIEQGTGRLLGFGESQSVTSAKNVFEPGDVLFGKLRPNLRKYWKADRRGICSTDILVLRGKQGLESDYLFAVVQSEPFLAFAENDAAGTKMPRTSWKRLETIELPIPPLNEQHRIAEILSSVDTSIQATQAVIEQAERVKRGLMEELLTGGLGSEAIERGEVPEGWKSSSIGTLTELQNGYGFKSKDWAQDGLPIIRIQNLNGGGDFNYFNGKYDEKYLVQKGDLLFCWSGSRGTSFGARYWTQEKGLLNQHIFKCIPKDGVEKAFLYYLLDWMTVAIEKEAHGGAGLAHIKKSEMVAFSCCVPSVSEQRRIAEVLSHFDDFIAGQKSIVEQQNLTKRGLMDDLLTGKVRAV